MAKSKKHPGFKSAKKKNPRLKRVKMAKKSKC